MTSAFVPCVAPFAPARSSAAASAICAPRCLGAASSRFTACRLHHRAHQQPRNSQRETVRCYAGSGGDEDEDDDDDELDDDDDDDKPDLLLEDSETGRSLPVGVQTVVPHDDVEYYVCYPMDDPVAFVRADDLGDGVLEPVEDPERIAQLLPNATAVLSEMNMQLLDTPFILTLSDYSDTGVLDADGSEVANEGEAEDEDEDEDDDEELLLGDDRDVEIVAEFSHQGANYYVVRPVEEVLVVAKSEDGEKFTVIDGEELDRVSPAIEKSIEQQRKELERSIMES